MEMTASCGCIQMGDLRGDRQANREYGAGAIGAVRRGDRAAHGLDEPAGDGKAEPGPGAHLIDLLHTIELVEDPFQVARGNALPLVHDLQADSIAIPPASDAD